MPVFFFFNDPATTEIYTLSLHDALPISATVCAYLWLRSGYIPKTLAAFGLVASAWCVFCAFVFLIFPHFNEVVNDYWRSEEHTSELQSQSNLVCRLLLEKKTKLFHPVSP